MCVSARGVKIYYMANSLPAASILSVRLTHKGTRKSSVTKEPFSASVEMGRSGKGPELHVWFPRPPIVRATHGVQ